MFTVFLLAKSSVNTVVTGWGFPSVFEPIDDGCGPDLPPPVLEAVKRWLKE
jgi:hypothetical protein